METQKVVYEFETWKNGKRYELCLVSSTNKTEFDLQKNKIVTIAMSHRDAFQLGINFTSHEWQKAFILLFDDKEGLSVHFKNKQKHLKVVTYQKTETSCLRYQFKGSGS